MEPALDDLTIEQKLAMMESLWESLRKHEQQLPSPKWHAEVLAERQRRLASGEAKFVEWEKAKANIRGRTS